MFYTHAYIFRIIKIAAIENTSEFKLGLSKGAIVNKGALYSFTCIDVFCGKKV